MLPAGSLRNLVTIQNVSHTSTFENPQTWTDGSQLWASIKYDTSTEKNQQGVVQCFTTATFRTHYRTDITHKNRLKLGSRIFNVSAVVNVDEANEITEITAIEVV